MQKILLASAFLLFLAGPVTADEFLVNGSFEQAFDVGWTDTVESSAGTFAFERADTFGQPTPGFAAKVTKYLAKYASLRQTVDVPNLELSLSFDGRFKISGGSSTCWPVASLWIRYADANGLELGNTRICRSSVYSTWANSDTVHLIEIGDTTGAWHNYSINLKEELTANLPGVNPSDVAKVTVDLFAYDNGT
jgi:hypothetical protein